jgi:hypothetical protein
LELDSVELLQTGRTPKEEINKNKNKNLYMGGIDNSLSTVQETCIPDGALDWRMIISTLSTMKTGLSMFKTFRSRI